MGSVLGKTPGSAPLSAPLRLRSELKAEFENEKSRERSWKMRMERARAERQSGATNSWYWELAPCIGYKKQNNGRRLGYIAL